MLKLECDWNVIFGDSIALICFQSVDFFVEEEVDGDVREANLESLDFGRLRCQAVPVLRVLVDILLLGLEFVLLDDLDGGKA